MTTMREIPSLETLSLRALSVPSSLTFNISPSPTKLALLSNLSKHAKQPYKDDFGGLDFQSPWCCTTDRKHSTQPQPLVDFTLLTPPKPDPQLWGNRVILGGTRANDSLQRFIDAQAESGNLHDTRITVDFFEVYGDIMADALLVPDMARKKMRGSGANAPNVVIPMGIDMTLSLHNCALLSNSTFEAFKAASPRCGQFLTVLDLSGCYNVTSDILENLILPSARNVKRLSLKNCRKLTDAALPAIGRYLPRLLAVDLGGCYNVTPEETVSLVTTLKGSLGEIYAAGLGWSDETLPSLLRIYESDGACPLTGLSIGFAAKVSSATLLSTLPPVCDSLNSLSLQFMPTAVTLEVLTMLGRSGLSLCALDLRGNNNVYSLATFLDARATAWNEQSRAGGALKKVLVMARYSGIGADGGGDCREVYGGLFETIMI